MNSWICIKNKTNSFYSQKSFSHFEKLEYADISIYRKTDGRFFNDKVFFQDDNYMIVIDGVLLNLSELKIEYKCDNTYELLTKMYEEYKEKFISKLRGPFSGVFYDKNKDKLICFVNQTGDMAAYIFENNKYFISSSDFRYIIQFLYENNISYHFNDKAAIYMLTFGFMIDDSTFAKGVKRILPGQYVTVERNVSKIVNYYMLDNTKTIKCTLDEAVELIDEGFKKAVKRCFDKDLEYGYTCHLADMSAGLDSRMTSFVAKFLGYENITNMSYSQSVSDEFIMAKNASLSLGNEFLYQPLDDAMFIYDIEDIIKMNSGAAYYIGITGGRRLLSKINFNKYGLEHTGQLGDVIVSTFCKTDKELSMPTDINTKRNSTTLNIEFKDKNIETRYKNTELFNMYTRGFLGALSTHLIRKNYTYAVSPFIDIDFMEICFSLPLRYRINHRLYFKWIQEKYPEAFKLPSSRKQKTLKAQLLNFPKRVYRKIMREGRGICLKLGIAQYSQNPNHMNPFNYWYETNYQIRNFINEYYNKNLPKLQDIAQTHTIDNIKKLFKYGDAFDKLLVITVLGVYKCYFEEVDKLDKINF